MVLAPDEQQLTQLVGDALRSHDTERASLLRMLKNSLHNAAITAGGTLDEQGRVSVYRKEAKQRLESAIVFEQGGRADTAENERSEAYFIQTFLPQLASQSQIDTAVKSAIMRGVTVKGMLIKEVREQFNGNVDGKQLADTVTTHIS